MATGSLRKRRGRAGESMDEEAKRILLVDDSKLFLEIESSFLAQRGYEILSARTGREALEKARKHRPHVILLDLSMPEIDGDEVCKQIKADPALKDTVVIMLTSADRQEDRARCIAAGCDGYLTKTVNRSELLASVARGLQQVVRYDPRLPINVKVEYRTGGGEPQSGVTLNLSVSGMFIITEDPPPIGMQVEVEFELPDLAERFGLTGHAAWNTSGMKRGATVHGFGLKFSEGDPADFLQISDYVAKHLSE
ncbi:MAG: response regulator [Deltaproteobacteria bacterium]|nr:response regulator [Deltaproteobacteria bacterium]